MTTTENDIIRDEQERSNLLRAMADVETAAAVSTPGTRRILEMSLAGMKVRVASLDKKIEEAKVELEHEAQAQAVVAAAALAAKETKLSAEEREEYGSFLAKEFFTKTDFGRLEHFYAHVWDRLSESGKNQMSHRIWEGIRHDEYRFAELPEDVQDKEAKRIYAKLNLQIIDRGSLANIPQDDRVDFLRAYNSGDRQRTSEVLDRESFRRHVAAEIEIPIKHQSVSAGKTKDDDQLLTINASTAADVPPVPPPNTADSKLSSVDMSGWVMQESDLPPSSAAIPDAANAGRISDRSPV